MNTLILKNPSITNRSGLKFANWFSIVVSGFVIAFFAYYVTIYSVNFPFQDDNSLLQIITELKKGLGWKYNIAVFFRTENDHRIFFPRLISYFDYAISGQLNFKNYIHIATINLIIITGFIFWLFRKLKLHYYYFLPIPLLIFQPQYYEVSIWALTGLQHTTLLVLLFICLNLLEKPSPLKVGIAVILAMMATFTHGNGIMVFVTGGFLLLIERQYKVFIPWILSMLVALGFYLSDYTPGSGVKSAINWLNIPPTFMAKIGANLSVWQSVSIGASIVWGAVICVLTIPTLIIIFYKSFTTSKARPTIKNELFAFFCFIFLTTLLITIFRSNSEIILENRFKIYATLSSVFFYLFLIYSFPDWRKSIFVFFAVLSFIIYTSSYFKYTPEVINKYSRSVADTYNWRKHQTELCNYSSIESSLYFLLPAYQQGYWRVPDLFPGFDDLVKSTIQQQNFKSYTFLTQHFMYAESDSPQLFLEIDNMPLHREGMRDDLFVVLHDEARQKTYLAGTLPKLAGRRKLLKQGIYFGPGFSTVIPLQAVRQGQYRLGCFLKKADGQIELVMTRQIITL